MLSLGKQVMGQRMESTAGNGELPRVDSSTLPWSVMMTERSVAPGSELANRVVCVGGWIEPGEL